MVAIQIGANRGSDDFTNIIKTKLVTTLILVEPLSIFNTALETCYSGIKNKFIENIIITDIDNSITSKLYYHKLDGLEYGNYFELASLNPEHTFNIRGHYNREDLIEEEIESSTISELLDKYNIKHVDLLFIDTEGYDSKIIKSINFEKYSISEIYYENLHGDMYDLRNFLESKNYEITTNVLSFGWSDYAKSKN